eukprot:2645689-Amphidinium_carterae.1
MDSAVGEKRFSLSIVKLSERHVIIARKVWGQHIAICAHASTNILLQLLPRILLGRLSECIAQGFNGRSGLARGTRR